MDPCSIGRSLKQEEVCHKTTYTNGKIGISNVADLGCTDKELLKLRSGCSDLTDEATVCLHHQKYFLVKYSFLQKLCCDPLNLHPNCKRSHSLRIINAEKARELTVRTGKSIKPGQKWCPPCVIKDSEVRGTCIDEDAEMADYEYTPTSAASKEETLALSSVHAEKMDLMNESLAGAGFSPIKPSVISQRDKASYGKRKCSELQEVVSHDVAECLAVDLPPPPEIPTQPCERCQDLDRLIDLLKEKIRISPSQKKVQMLTLAPSSWSISKTAQEFEVSEHKVKLARKLMKERGILGEVESKLGRPLSKDTELRVKQFYRDDQYSRLLPGAKDYKSVVEEGKRTRKQKRLILMNLNELYQKYKETHPLDKIGLSKFCALRPLECITVGCRGTHSVCVCTIHQNVKLMVHALPVLADPKVSYKDLMQKLVCSTSDRLCMLHRCPNCPGSEALLEHLEGILEAVDVSLDDSVQYKQWVSTDRTNLQDFTSSFQDFLDTLTEKLDKLTSHHFIAKHQSSYLAQLKNDIHQNEAVVILDFAENYSFLIQDAAQGFHWENSQATLHPFVAYYKDDCEGTRHVSMCVISDHLQHSTSTVHCFQQEALSCLREICPSLSKVYYFSDGAASQYKNFKNFSNLVHHQ
jgi:hypothetical protein